MFRGDKLSNTENNKDINKKEDIKDSVEKDSVEKDNKQSEKKTRVKKKLSPLQKKVKIIPLGGLGEI